jgi:hypothetical protein
LKEKAAGDGLKVIEKALLQYKLNNRNFPDNLKTLGESEGGKPALLEEKDLLDPWGRPYQYDPSKRSKTGRPLIFSQGPNPADSAGIIRNWKPEADSKTP